MQERSRIIVSMNQLSREKRAAVVRCLVEGNSIRATVRITGVAKNTVTKLLVDLGNACEVYQDETFRNLGCERMEVDEIWSFCYAKQKNVPHDLKGEFGYGDIWTFTAIDSDTKLIPTWLVGERNYEDAQAFIHDLSERLNNRIQLTTDGLKVYLTAVRRTFGEGVDYAILHKIYGKSEAEKAEARYSPAKCIGTVQQAVIGAPDVSKISTSYVERANLTMRMGMRRFTRLTNAFSKKVDNLSAAVALHFAYYNFVRVHTTLKTTPAVAAGVTDHVWTIEELVGLLDGTTQAMASN